MKHKILLVDDEPANLRTLERLLREEHEVVTAESGADAIELLAHHAVALIISDQRMPGMTGLEFLKRAAEIRPQTTRIILTGYTDVGDLVEAVNCGVVYKYITKPWVNTDLLQNVQRALEHHESMKAQHLLNSENERLENKLHAAVEGFVEGILEMIGQKNSNLAGHCRRTAVNAAVIGARLELGAEDLRLLRYASLLHEVPNMRMPFDMSLAKIALTDKQLAATQNNYENGLGLISTVPDLDEVAVIIRYQHERYDGTGFLHGLASNSIPLMSRILAVASAFDDISSGRNAVSTVTDEQAASRLRARAGTEFDPGIVETCLGRRSTAQVDSVAFTPIAIPTPAISLAEVLA